MKRTAINPTEWGLGFSMNQAELVEGVTRVLHCSGQTAIVVDTSAESGISVSHPGDMRSQIQVALAGIDALLERANMTRANILSLRFYTTDVDSFLASYDVYADWIGEVESRPPQTLLGIDRLALRDLLVEIEAVAGA